MFTVATSTGSGTAQYSTAQHSTAQHSTAQHSTAQHSTSGKSHARRELPSKQLHQKMTTKDPTDFQAGFLRQRQATARKKKHAVVHHRRVLQSQTLTCALNKGECQSATRYNGLLLSRLTVRGTKWRKDEHSATAL